MDPDTFYSHINMCRVCPSTENLIYLYIPSNKTVLNNLKFIVHIEVSSKNNIDFLYINLSLFIYRMKARQNFLNSYVNNV